MLQNENSHPHYTKSFKKKKSFSSSLERSTIRIHTSKDANAHRQHNPCSYKTICIKRVFSVRGPNAQHRLSLVSTEEFLPQCSIEINKMRIPVKKSGKETSRELPEFPILLCNFGSITAGSSEGRRWELSFMAPARQHPARLLSGTGLLDRTALLRNSHLLTAGWPGCERPR